jgi:hypothetical protein
MRRALLLLPLLAGLLSCGVEPDVGLEAPVSVAFPLPVDCATVPTGVEAVLWISGSSAPETLDVDPATLAASGNVTFTTGTERTIVLDWFTRGTGPDGEVRVLLAQATRTLDLTDPVNAPPDGSFAAEDIEVASCVDVRDDTTRAGSPTVVFGGQDRPVCDLDDSCGGSLGPDCSNLGELCAGTDPLAP